MASSNYRSVRPRLTIYVCQEQPNSTVLQGQPQAAGSGDENGSGTPCGGYWGHFRSLVFPEVARYKLVEDCGVPATGLTAAAVGPSPGERRKLEPFLVLSDACCRSFYMALCMRYPGLEHVETWVNVTLSACWGNKWVSLSSPVSLTRWKERASSHMSKGESM